MNTQPRIVCAAVKSQDGVIVASPRHMDQIARNTIRELVGCESVRQWSEGSEQGFLDQFGTYYNRTEAWKIAEAAGQILRRCGGDTANGGTLYSENLY